MLSLPDLLTALSHPSSWPTTAWVLILTAAAYATGSSCLAGRPAFPLKAPPVFAAWPVVGALRFFSDRKAFLEEIAGASASGQGASTMASTGSRDLDIDGGYSTLFNAAPEVTTEERVQLGTRIRKLVYQLTMRTVGCAEIAGDPALLAETLAIFEGIDSAGAGGKLLVPSWMTTPGHLRRLWAGTKMYLLFKKIIDARARDGVRHDDPLQVLIDQKWDVKDIIAVVIAALFAGQVNSGYNAAWLLCYLGQNTRWRDLIRDEVDNVIRRHRSSPEQSPADVLSTLNFDDWEVEFPLLDIALRETIRLTIVGCGFRQNSSDRDVVIGETGEIVPAGAFAVYLFDDVHLNPNVYKDPETWDPDRFLEGRAEDKRLAPTATLAGVAAAIRVFAKLEMAAMISMFVAHFDYHLVDAQGAPITATPDLFDRSKHQVHRPTKPVLVKYQLREGVRV
ncbi:unnamed protein product [Parascedosporium putredinis]|uniref:Cytochrome P450 n=1 Tax=Parascedosporium putredinis TaxID=1442378 RepID=A0A9P1GZZ2_9PEZI|nr:unnamed protein product [Parascedosporium putredinis]CAI7991298.1 unnamed protein product [Parascedosporium putredinis]